MIDIENNIATIEISSGDTYIEIGTTYIPPTIDITDAETLNGELPSHYLNRANHTGSQPISTITGLQNSLNTITSDIENLEINKLDVSAYNDRFKGLYATFFDLTTAHPTASAGDYAQVDFGLGEDVIVYAWDASDEYWSAIGVVSIANTDALPEGSANLYFTETRVRGTTLSTLSVINSSISSLDSVITAFGKLQGQLDNKTPLSHVGSGSDSHAVATASTAGFMSAGDKTKIDGLSTVATSGSYNDLSNKPTINEADRTLVHKTLTRWKSRSTTGNLLPFDLAQRGVFDTNYVIPANTIIVGDSYRLEMGLFIDIVSAQSGNYELAPIFNDSLFPLTPTNVTISLGTLTVSQMIHVVFDVTFPSVGTSGRIIQSGFLTNRNAITFFTSNTSTINTTQDISLNYSARFTSTVGAGNGAYIKYARFYRINDPV